MKKLQRFENVIGYVGWIVVRIKAIEKMGQHA